MSYNIESLHNIQVDKILTKKRLHHQLTAATDDSLILKITNKLKQYEEVTETMEEYHLNNLELIMLLDNKETNVPDEMYNDYVKRYFVKENKPVETDGDRESSDTRCESCGGNVFILITKSDDKVCQQCGATEVAHQKVCSYERSLELRLSGKKVGYSKSKSLAEYLDYIQLRKNQGISPQDEMRVIELLQGFRKERIDVNLIHGCMRMLKLSKFYGDKYYLFKKLTGKQITLSPGTEKQIHCHFFLEQNAFVNLQEEGKIKRWNIFVYRYSVCKIAQLLVFKLSNPGYCDKVEDECTSDLSDVNKQELETLLEIIPQPLVESVATLELYDEYWHLICVVNGWKFLSSR